MQAGMGAFILLQILKGVIRDVVLLKGVTTLVRTMGSDKFPWAQLVRGEWFCFIL